MRTVALGAQDAACKAKSVRFVVLTPKGLKSVVAGAIALQQATVKEW
jgi:hypothetical protein